MVDLPFSFYIPSGLLLGWTRLVDDLRVDIPGAPLTTLQSNLYRATDEFLDYTNVWQEDQNVTLVAATRAYTLTQPLQGMFTRLLVYFDPTDTQLNWAGNVAFYPPNGLVLADTPATTGAVRAVRMVKRLSAIDANNNPDIPDDIIQKYREVISDGARRYLHSMPNMPWTDKALATFWGQKFVAGKTIARIDKIKGNVVGQTNWSYPRPYRPSTQRGA